MREQTMNELVSINPATLEEIGRIPITTEEELDQAVRNAGSAFTQWKTDRTYRQELLHSCALELTRKSTEIVPLLVKEQGKTATEAGGEMWISAKNFTHAAQIEWADEEFGPDVAGRTARIQRVPLGTVAAIVPWNFPVFLMVAKIAPALAAGNTVVVKPAESVSLVVDKVVEVLAAILPEGVIQVVHGGPAIGKALVEHPLIRKVTFTGSTGVGKLIMKQAAESITPVTLELGGNDPAIVLEDADIASTAQFLVNSAFFNAGQMCVAPKRAYVPAGKVDEFCQVFSELMARLTVGDGLAPGTTTGPLHNKAQLDFVQGLLDKAVAGGATIVAGGKPGTDLPGYFLEPTLVRDVDDSAEIVALEQFGPVFPVVAYNSLDEVIATVNAQEFGLGASVWGADEAAATAVAERIDAGSVWVNQHNALEVELPFGGTKSSGFGREGGLAGIEDFLQTRVISVKHIS
ncbi:aldehyde dehydrogenase family protein [Rhodococcus sp. IEGM 1241]|uniref:aldehyde dehydrogenase family protein n=1 Tax=Rhodococcus sp. IEGM 1241 TaxID=3082228 RepID=UPI0029546064|nr:aldehyde dehydrogenase family protein [Rhodococcus sp. IEGM 1241]MDV8015176.1 aldehyde dehydrogenase family protein [Rhodococcus sp. IEGM 1241]